MSKGKKIGRIVISVILWIIILLAALYAFVTLATKDPGNPASIGGFTPLTIESNSMAPTFEKGDLIFVKKTDPATLVEGDIITFRTIIDNKIALNTHRIVKIETINGARSYTTQGDNNDMKDQHIINDGDIVGKYISKIKGLGNFINFLSGKIGFFIIIVLPMLAFFIYQLYHLIMVSIELKKANAIEAALEAEEIKQQGDMDEASKMMEEAKRMQAEAEAAIAKAKAMQEDNNDNNDDNDDKE